jgi:hypothetical protein
MRHVANAGHLKQLAPQQHSLIHVPEHKSSRRGVGQSGRGEGGRWRRASAVEKSGGKAGRWKGGDVHSTHAIRRRLTMPGGRGRVCSAAAASFWLPIRIDTSDEVNVQLSRALLRHAAQRIPRTCLSLVVCVNREDEMER